MIITSEEGALTDRARRLSTHAGASAEWLVARVQDRSARGIADTVAGLIAAGELTVDARLPTIRRVADVSGVSAGTVAEAWSILKSAGLVSTRRRGGTVVGPPAEVGKPRSEGTFPGWSRIDLVTDSPDIALLPSLDQALAASLRGEHLHSLTREHMTGRLREAVAPTWPYPPEAWSTAGGPIESLLLAVEAATVPGQTVLVDEPIVPGLLDTLKELNLHPIGIPCDENGPSPDAVSVALRADPAAFIYQPSSPFSLGHSVTQARVSELARIFAEHPHPVWIIEDDSVGSLTSANEVTFGHDLSGQVLRIRSYCKAYGLDLRTTVLAGPRELVERIRQVRSHGAGVNSRILQNTLAFLISDSHTAQSVARARKRYAARRESLMVALEGRGVHCYGGDQGLVVWVPVADAAQAVSDLAHHGIVVGTGSRSFLTPQKHDYLRVSVTELSDSSQHVAELAEVLAGATRGELRQFFD